MYPFASLPENLAAFCARLRREYGFRIGPRQLHDAVRALEKTSIADERTVRDTLRPILASTFEDVAAFDRAFDAFFHPVPVSSSSLSADARRAHDASTGARKGAPATPTAADSLLPADGGRGAGVVTESDEADEEPGGSAGLLRASYSPTEAEGPAPLLEPPDWRWRQAALALVVRVQRGLSRRWRPAPRGPRFDLRRTLRSSLHTGGEPVSPRWRARPRLHAKFVLLVDGSRSMGTHTAPALATAVALAAVTPNVEVFVFSTSLQRVTRDVRRAAAGTRVQLCDLHHAWGGGTSLGTCLRDFVRRHGERMLGRDSVVIIASDGLDVGGPDVLRGAMADLHRRSASVVWLNPLIETPGYEPIATGMRTARAYVSTFAWVGDPEALRKVARLVRVRS